MLGIKRWVRQSLPRRSSGSDKGETDKQKVTIQHCKCNNEGMEYCREGSCLRSDRL